MKDIGSRLKNLRETKPMTPAESSAAGWERHGTAKIKKEWVPTILHLLATGITQREIAAIFSVDHSAICRLKNRDLT